MDPEPRDGEIHVWPIRNNLYMLVGDEGNIVVQIGTEGPLVVDTGTGRLADKTIAAIRQLSDKPISSLPIPASVRIDQAATRSCEHRGPIPASEELSFHFNFGTQELARRSSRIRTSRAE